MADETSSSSASLQTKFWQLRALSRSCLASDDDDLMVTDRSNEFIGILRNRQFLRNLNLLNFDRHDGDDGNR